MRIEIGRRNYLAYLLLSHPAKIARLSSESRRRLDDINRAFNERIYFGRRAPASTTASTSYTERRSDQNDYPARALVDETWVGEGYGRALELGAGSGYFTTLIARHARSLVAIEPVPDIRAVLVERCRREGLAHVQVLGATALDLPAAPRRGVDRLRLRHPEPASLPPSRRGVPRAGPGGAAGRQAVPRGAAPQSPARAPVDEEIRDRVPRPGVLAATSATGRPTTSSHAASYGPCVGRPASPTCSSRGTGSRGRAAWWPTRVGASGSSARSGGCPGFAISQRYWR